MGVKSRYLTIQVGIWKGKKIPMPGAVSGHRHFTGGLVKEASFQQFENHFQEKKNTVAYFDLCSGSGQMGLEAISRGYDSAHLVELDVKRFAALRSVVQQKPFSEKTIQLHRKDFLRMPQIILETVQYSDVAVFLDPPYSFWNRDRCEKAVQFLDQLYFNYNSEHTLMVQIQGPEPLHIIDSDLREKAQFRSYRGQYLTILILNS